MSLRFSTADIDLICGRRPVRAALTPGRVGSALLGAAAMATFVALPHQEANGSAPTAAQRSWQPAWADSVPSTTVVARSVTGPLSAAIVHEVREQTGGLGREDIVTSGKADGVGSFRRIIVQRGGVSVLSGSLFVELARRSAETELAITHAEQPILLQTHFGSLEVARVTAAGPSGSLSCLGFRSGNAGSAAHVIGLACENQDAKLDPAALACTLNAIDMTGPQASVSLASVFDARRSTACAADATAATQPAGGPDRPATEPGRKRVAKSV